MRPISHDFSTDDLQAVEDAVKAAEKRTSGEIVTYIAASSDSYTLASWRGATYGALLGALVAVTVMARSNLWVEWIEAWILAPPLAGGALGYLLPLAFDPIKRALVDTDLREERVRRRSREVFLQEEVFNTRERTGILLYVSMFERRLEVLADSGVRLMVPPEVWEEIVDLMTEAFDRGEPSAGLLAAVEKCGLILGRDSLAHPPDDANELADPPRIEEEE